MKPALKIVLTVLGLSLCVLPPHLSAANGAADWVGWWHERAAVKGVKNDLLLLTPGTEPGSIKVSGRAYWYGLNDNVHFGQVNGEAIPDGDHLRVTDVGSGCVLDLTLRKGDGTSAMGVEDNSKCGGANVRFHGTWHKFTPSVKQ